MRREVLEFGASLIRNLTISAFTLYVVSIHWNDKWVKPFLIEVKVKCLTFSVNPMAAVNLATHGAWTFWTPYNIMAWYFFSKIFTIDSHGLPLNTRSGVPFVRLECALFPAVIMPLFYAIWYYVMTKILSDLYLVQRYLLVHRMNDG